MPTPTPDIILLLSTFSVAFTQPTFQKALVLLYGTILAPRRRTVAAALRMTGHGNDPHFSRFHRFLNRDRWSPWVVSRLLLGMVVSHLVLPDAGLVLIIDDTLERRRGPEIKLKGWCHDPLLAATRKVAASLGIRWICQGACHSPLVPATVGAPDHGRAGSHRQEQLGAWPAPPHHRRPGDDDGRPRQTLAAGPRDHCGG